ncbi:MULTISPECIES: hypothetical protein [unclassified Knoellia]|uniref:hypothetical protein n=1 Tax=Knoellia altitudinis TaxID=3404795 RepID=UPI00360D0646
MAAALAIAAGTVGMTATTAAADPAAPNAAQLCKMSNNADGYLGSHGGCVSSVASIGMDALMEGAFPTRAAAIANCKGIEEMVGGFPYYFYGREGDSRYLATNYASCVGILYQLHTGQLQPGPA